MNIYCPPAARGSQCNHLSTISAMSVHRHALFFQDLGYHWDEMSDDMQVRGDASHIRQELGANDGSGQSVAGTCVK